MAALIQISSPRRSLMADDTVNSEVTPTIDDSVRKKLDEQRVEFGNTIKNFFPILFVLTVVIATSLVVLIACGFFAGRTMDATVLAASVQVAFGMVLGFVCVYIGLMMTWIGIDAAYSVKGDVGAGSFVLRSASPGLLFATGGIVLVSVSLYKEITYEENTGRLVGTQAIEPEAPRSVVPEAPRRFIEPDQISNPVPSRSNLGTMPSTPANFSGQIQFGTQSPSPQPTEDN
jgi:hypothetical protein